MNKRIIKKQLKKTGKYVHPRETWSLDITIAKYILPRLKAFKVHTNGYPSCLSSMDEWYEILDKMITAFQLITDGEIFEPKAESEREKDNKIIDEGLELFRKYYFNLWRG